MVGNCIRHKWVSWYLADCSVWLCLFLEYWSFSQETRSISWLCFVKVHFPSMSKCLFSPIASCKSTASVHFVHVVIVEFSGLHYWFLHVFKCLLYDCDISWSYFSIREHVRLFLLRFSGVSWSYLMFIWKSTVCVCFLLLSFPVIYYIEILCTIKVHVWGFLVFGALYRGSYMSAHALLNLLNELGKRDKMRGLPSILSLFRNEFNKFNNTRARMLDSIYHMTNTMKSHFWRKNVIILSIWRNVVMDVITFPVNL